MTGEEVCHIREEFVEEMKKLKRAQEELVRAELDLSRAYLQRDRKKPLSVVEAVDAMNHAFDRFGDELVKEAKKVSKRLSQYYSRKVNR